MSAAAPRRNRVDPFGDLRAVPERGRFTGNRGVLVDVDRRLVRHHQGNLWITCVTEYGDRRHGLDDPGTWTPLFFLDDAVALAAGHRPCGECRPSAYRAYRAGLTDGLGVTRTVGATEINRRLARERLRRGQGLERAGDRILWESPLEDLPDGTVMVEPGQRARLVLGDRTLAFDFGGWRSPRPRPSGVVVTVLTPPTSVAALRHGFVPELHPSAIAAAGRGQSDASAGRAWRPGPRAVELD